MTRRTKIFIFGDSFGDVRACGSDHGRAWPNIVTQLLAKQFNRPIEIINWSMIGASQDHTWSCIMKCIENGDITPDDYMIVLMTSPERFWFFEDVPYITNTAIIDFDDVVSKEQTAAAAQYFQYIQRPQLFNMHLDLRLGWLSYLVKSMGLRRPLMIPCFEQSFAAASYPALNFAQGCLYTVQVNEWSNPSENNWHGIDLRYAHLCLRNHAVLAPMIVNSLWRGVNLDLNSDNFHQGFLTSESADDPVFFDAELSATQRDKLMEKTTADRTPWAQRLGIIKKST